MVALCELGIPRFDAAQLPGHSVAAAASNDSDFAEAIRLVRLYYGKRIGLQ